MSLLDHLLPMDPLVILCASGIASGVVLLVGFVCGLCGMAKGN